MTVAQCTALSPSPYLLGRLPNHHEDAIPDVASKIRLFAYCLWRHSLRRCVSSVSRYHWLMHALYSLLSLAIMMLEVHDSCTAMPAEEDGTYKSATGVHNLHRRSPTPPRGRRMSRRLLPRTLPPARRTSRGAVEDLNLPPHAAVVISTMLNSYRP